MRHSWRSPLRMVVKATPFTPSETTNPVFGRAPRPPGSRWRRSGFWGAVAGMAVAVALGCMIVALEMAGEFDQRALHFRHRADQLMARLGRTQQRLTVATREVAEMRRQASVRALFDQIVAAPDGQVVRLDAPDRRVAWRGALAFSQHLSQAVLEVTGLAQTGVSGRFALHWVRRQGAPILAAEFPAYDPGQPDVVVQLAPPPPEAIAAVVERTDPESSNSKGTGSLMLRADLHRTVGVRERKSGRKQEQR